MCKMTTKWPTFTKWVMELGEKMPEDMHIKYLKEHKAPYTPTDPDVALHITHYHSPMEPTAMMCDWDYPGFHMFEDTGLWHEYLANGADEPFVRWAFGIDPKKAQPFVSKYFYMDGLPDYVSLDYIGSNVVAQTISLGQLANMGGHVAAIIRSDKEAHWKVVGDQYWDKVGIHVEDGQLLSIEFVAFPCGNIRAVV